jgi:hypothetical protein
MIINLFTVVVKKHFRQTFSPASHSRCIYKNSDSRRHLGLQSLRCPAIACDLCDVICDLCNVTETTATLLTTRTTGYCIGFPATSFLGTVLQALCTQIDVQGGKSPVPGLCTTSQNILMSIVQQS